MASVDELLRQFEHDPDMQAEAGRILADGRLSMRDALRLYRKYRPDVPTEKLLYYFRHLPEAIEKARRRGIIP